MDNEFGAIDENDLKKIVDYADQQIEFLTGEETKEDLMGFVGETACVIQSECQMCPLEQVIDIVKSRLPEELYKKYVQ